MKHTGAKKNSETFSIHQFMDILSREYQSWQAPVITLMARQNATPFQVLISTVLSLRTKDEVTAAAAARLFEKANDPKTMAELTEATIRDLIYPVGFYPTKAKRILEICRILMEKHNGQVPKRMKQLLELPGVGRKTANLVLVEGFRIPAICVDTHVHRISNRCGYVKTQSPEKTEAALRKKLPKQYWISYNEILVAFGQTICRPISPFCSRCPVAQMCPKIGVTRSR